MASSGDPAPDQIDWSKKSRYRAEFRRRSGLAFLLLSFGSGVVAFLTPILLPLVGGYDGHYSISYFYHVPATRDLFVGLLWSTGTFLFFYRGLSIWENLLLSMAGIFLVLVAMVPTGLDQCGGTMFSWHAGFAVAFFACLFVVAVFLAKTRLSFIIWPPLRRRFERLYTLSGVLMIAAPLTAYALHFQRGAECSHVIYWIEATAIWAYSLYWFTKTWEYKKLLGIRIRQRIRRSLREAGLMR